MNNKVKEILCNSIIHIDIGKRRCAGDEDLYEKNLRQFAGDLDYNAIVTALKAGDYYLAERFAQRLKLKSYNLGMVRLSKSCDALCLSIQAGRGAPEFQTEMRDVTVVYGIMRECIDKAFSDAEAKPAKDRPKV
jgi:hypothetical protein